MPEVPGRQMVYWENVSGGDRIVQRIENFCPYHEGMDELVRAGRSWRLLILYWNRHQCTLHLTRGTTAFGGS